MQLPRLILASGALLGALFFTGCATITRGTSEQLMFQSEPSGAQVKLSNGFTGITPVSFTVPRKGNVIVTVTKEGYESAQVEVKSELSGKGTAGFLGNVLIGGVIGGGVDVATGATLSHTPNPVKVTLFPRKPVEQVAEAKQPTPEVPKTEPASGTMVASAPAEIKTDSASASSSAPAAPGK